jgi:hypothetical protein
MRVEVIAGAHGYSNVEPRSQWPRAAVRNNDLGRHCWVRVIKSTVPLHYSYKRNNLLTSSPVIWREEHLWNFSVLQRVDVSNFLRAEDTFHTKLSVLCLHCHYALLNKQTSEQSQQDVCIQAVEIRPLPPYVVVTLSLTSLSDSTWRHAGGGEV